jgi:hypothetical protein
MATRSVLGLVQKHLRPSLWTPPASPANDFYWPKQTRANWQGLRPCVAPDVMGPDGESLWPWLAGLGQNYADPDLRRDFSKLNRGSAPILPLAAFRLACALEWLAPGEQRQSTYRRLAMGAAPDPRDPLAMLSRDWLWLLWNGAYELMSQCMQACGARAQDVPANCFAPLLDAQEGTRSVVLQSWPASYGTDWRRFVQGMAPLAKWELAGGALPSPWQSLVGPWGLLRKGAKGKQPQGDVAQVVQEKLEASWVRKAREWSGDASFRQKDVPWGRQALKRMPNPAVEGVGRVSPLALLLAAIAFDKHISADQTLWLKLESKMADQQVLGVPWGAQSWRLDDEVERVQERVNTAECTAPAKGLGGAELPASGGPHGRFFQTTSSSSASVLAAAGRAEAVGKGAQAVRLSAPTPVDGDVSVLRQTVPIAKLGTAQEAAQQRWNQAAPTCYVEVTSLASGQQAPLFMADVEEADIEAPADRWLFDLRPRPGFGSSLLALWDGAISPSSVLYEPWLVNAGPEQGPWWPVLFLRVTAP